MSDFDGNPVDLFSGGVVAAVPAVHPQLLEQAAPMREAIAMGQLDFSFSLALGVGVCSLRGMNGLGQESSLYLRQHAEQPVNWHAWGMRRLRRLASGMCRCLFRSGTRLVTGVM